MMYVYCNKNGKWCVKDYNSGEIEMCDGMPLKLVAKDGSSVSCEWKETKFDPEIILHLQHIDGEILESGIKMCSGTIVQSVGPRSSQR